MPRFEYKLIAAPVKSTKHKGLKGADTFAATVQDAMNALGADGWQYLRSETLPEDIRSGLTSRTTVYRHILVFQRALPADADPRTGSGTGTAEDTAPDTGQATATAPFPRLARRAAPPAPLPELARDDDEPALANLFLDPDIPSDTDDPTRR